MKKINRRKRIISEIILEKPEAVLVVNKYNVLFGMLKRIYPNEINKIPKPIFMDIIFDAVNGNRDWQMLTEDCDKENKNKLENEWLKNNYGQNK